MGIREIISKNIVGLRKKAGLTQAELADKLNYSDKAISKRERGESLPDAEMLYNIAQLFHVKISFLFEEHKFDKATEEEFLKLKKKSTTIKILLSLSISFVPVLILSIVIGALSNVINLKTTPFGIILLTLSGIALFILLMNIFFRYRKYLLLLASATNWLFFLGLFFFLFEYKLYLLFYISVGLQILIIFIPKIYDYLSINDNNY